MALAREIQSRILKPDNDKSVTSLKLRPWQGICVNCKQSCCVGFYRHSKPTSQHDGRATRTQAPARPGASQLEKRCLDEKGSLRPFLFQSLHRLLLFLTSVQFIGYHKTCCGRYPLSFPSSPFVDSAYFADFSLKLFVQDQA